MVEVQGKEDAAQRAYDWQQGRRKPDGRFEVPVQGFGRRGELTLWLPSSEGGVSYRFQAGRPERVITGGCFDDPALRQLRDELFASIEQDPTSGVLTIDVRFLEYAAKLLLTNYALSDADLDEALQGRRWHEQVMRHMLGGEGAVRMLAETAPELLYRLSPPPPPPAPAPPMPPVRIPAAEPTPAGPRKLRITRLLFPFRRR